MNFEWELDAQRGQKGIGYVEIHSASAEGHRVRAVISYLPQITGLQEQKQVNVCLLFEGMPEEMTDGLFHWIYDDLSNIVKSKEDAYFEASATNLQYIITQTLAIDRMPELQLFSHGDYATI